ncbi:MAG: TonB-dependent receptor [Candidatus Marinimicrobia bacterium]|nr:TonB-dependent receptor [Candidatus Neomarinimicrobiota bacterium]
MRRLYLILVIVILTQVMIGQPIRHPQGILGQFSKVGGKITGIVQDSVSGKYIEYANVMLFTLPDSTMLTGTITDKHGRFVIDGVRPGRYFLKVDFIGFKMKDINHIEIKPSNMEVDMGVINLIPSVIQMGEVEVVGERPLMNYSIDRKVINVDRHITSSAGTAIEILEKVPSVNVDIEGNVTLRGSGNFTVLIDNKPTILESNEALQQIPAAAIERIEIITNPSAKYDPDGVAGIINVILKKDVSQKFGGLINSSVGSNGQYGANVTLSSGNKKVRYSLGLDYNRRNFPGNRNMVNVTTVNGITSMISTIGSSKRIWNPYGIRGEIVLDITSKSILNIGGRFGLRSMENFSKSVITRTYSNTNIDIKNKNVEKWKRSGSFRSFYADFTHSFNNKGNYLKAQINYGSRGGDEKSVTEMYDDFGNIIYGQKNIEEGPGSRMRYRLEYVLPFDSVRKFEAGIVARISKSEDGTEYYDYDTLGSEYVFHPEFSHTIDYSRNIQSMYALYSSQIGDFGYQIGIRGEYTYRYITYVDSSYNFKIDRWDFFPTFHFSYKISNIQQLMMSYSRRIRRPRGWELEPFLTWMDAYNVRKGNPELKPEYTDSYEAGYQTFVGNNLVSIEGYYRKTYNREERVQSVYKENIILHTVTNVGRDQALGLEFMVNFNPFRWWSFDLMLNTYDYRIEGKLNDKDFSRHSFNWNTRFINEFKISRRLQAQLMLMYNSRSVSAQGERSDFYIMDLGIRYDVIPKKLTAILQVRDLFDTGKFEFKNYGEGFSTHGHFERKAPIFNLTLRYNFNNYRDERRQRQSGEQDLEDFESPSEIQGY